MKKIYHIIAGLLLLSMVANAQNLSGVKILVNPGHGGFDSDDRNMVIYPFTSGDRNGFWESQSNLDKGLQLRDLLENAQCQVVMSRLTNNPTVYDENGKLVYSDDTPLSQIVQMANEADADYMLSIHSNAGVTNYILQLFAGIDDGDTYNYSSPLPIRTRVRPSVP